VLSTSSGGSCASLKKRGVALGGAIEQAQNSIQWRTGAGATDVVELNVAGTAVSVTQTPGKEANSTGGTGSTVWNCAFVMCKYLEKLARSGNWSDRTVLEVGSGTGVVGLACALALRPKCLIISDLEEQIPLIRLNVERAKAAATPDTADLWARVKIAEFNWASAPTMQPGPPYDIVVASDCVWPKVDNALLIQALLNVTDRNTLVMLAYEQRGKACQTTFFEPAARHFTFTRIPTAELDQKCMADDIELYQMRRLSA
jgi:predicted nicotinamide N-methyase